MGSFEFNIPDEFQKQLSKLANVDEVAPKMLEAASPIYEKYIKQSIVQSIQHKEKSTGDLVNSVKMSKVKKMRGGGVCVTAQFKGYDRRHNANAVKAAGLEFGNSHQEARPFVARANATSKQEVVDAMQEVFNKEVN